MQLLLDDARMLRQQLTAGGSSPGGAFGDALALVLLHSRAFSDDSRASSDDSRAFSDAKSPITLEFQTGLEAEDITDDDIDSLIQALEATRPRLKRGSRN